MISAKYSFEATCFIKKAGPFTGGPRLGRRGGHRGWARAPRTGAAVGAGGCLLCRLPEQELAGLREAGQVLGRVCPHLHPHSLAGDVAECDVVQ
jgi:hypothetical protein